METKFVKYPLPTLRKPCKDVEIPVWEVVKHHIDQLTFALANTPNGVALASNQLIENGWRVFVVKQGLDVDLPQVVINPSWEPTEDSTVITKEEGCLSIPHFGALIPRYSKVRLTYYDERGDGNSYNVLSELGSRIVQHECDHLAGKVIIDHLDKKSQIKAYNDILRRRKRGQ